MFKNAPVRGSIINGIDPDTGQSSSAVVSLERVKESLGEDANRNLYGALAPGSTSIFRRPILKMLNAKK